MNSTINERKPIGGFHCNKTALIDDFGWFLQVLLACLAFTCLIAKRFCEPKIERRSWLIWFYDTSKQGMGAIAIHLANVFLAGQYTGDPCTWYIINFLLDSSVGLLIIFIGIRLSQHLSKRNGWEAINFGEYGNPPSVNAWLAQCCLYIGLMVIVKTCITLLMQFNFWESVRDLILPPIDNPKIELAFVMLIIPFFVNILMFWVTDNFLMHRSSNTTDPTRIDHQNHSRKSGLQYRTVDNYRRVSCSETEGLLMDDELLDSEDIPHSPA